mgnify:CR=1 FL=1
MAPKGSFETFHIIKYIATEVKKMIEVNELVKKYGKKTVLNKISFKVDNYGEYFSYGRKCIYQWKRNS